jgi:hypothetical protein
VVRNHPIPNDGAGVFAVRAWKTMLGEERVGTLAVVHQRGDPDGLDGL